MHPFGGTARCPRCEKAVYAAEQVMGPGRKLYHKPCLTCTTCKKRLDSFTLLEHDLEPYCKICHVKNFGNRDLRQANLPDRDDVLGLSPNRTGGTLSPPMSPYRFDAVSLPSLSPTRATSSPNTPVRRNLTGGAVVESKPTNNASNDNARVNMSSPNIGMQEADIIEEEEEEEAEEAEAFVGGLRGMRTNTGRGPNGLPRTVLLSPAKTQARTVGRQAGAKDVEWNGKYNSVTMGRSSSAAAVTTATSQPPPLLMSTATGTRYGSALTGEGNSKGRWGGGGTTPICPRCNRPVYFAEQVKAIGKTYHTGCLRCTECSSLLDSTRLTEKDGSPFCHRCYGKLYGPQGSGYALLGKAGG